MATFINTQRLQTIINSERERGELLAESCFDSLTNKIQDRLDVFVLQSPNTTNLKITFDIVKMELGFPQFYNSPLLIGKKDDLELYTELPCYTKEHYHEVMHKKLAEVGFKSSGNNVFELDFNIKAAIASLDVESEDSSELL